jgi:hypothetical protein
MKKRLIRLLLFGCGVLFYNYIDAQQDWPKTVVATDGTIIKVYQPQPDSLAGNILKSRSAVSVLEKGDSDPVFGTLWSTARVETDRDDREVTIASIVLSTVKIPGDSSKARIDYIKATLEAQLPVTAGQISLDELLASLDQNLDERNLSKDINTQVPHIIYATHPSVLVTIDGAPRLQKNKKMGLEAVINSPFIIVQNKDHLFYLYGGGHWYSAPSATGPYSYIGGKPSSRLRRIGRDYDKAMADRDKDNMENTVADTTIPAVIISTTPAELVQTNGEPDLLPVQGTVLLYAENSPNDIFIDTQSQLYYILLSGRWYKNKTLDANGGWGYVASDQLPADFAKIPEGSPKDNVLASIAGTDAAREAVMDAQIPQTAKVDRKQASAHVTYDGVPQFQPIQGTRLQYALNTSSTVLLYANRYYAVDNGVWFVSDNAEGPWVASETRPGDLDLVPPSSSAYNAKFVDIYDVTPDYIYTGYTSGYLNDFIYGPTIVYGTGYYYSPWIGNYYYPRPWSWGFDMVYNPWYGWGFGAGYGFDWFNIGFGPGWDGWYGGWWGPGSYYPACWGYGAGYRPRPFYGRNVAMNGHIGIHSTNNIYRDREGIASGNHEGIARGRDNTTLNEHNGGRPANNVISDRQGNVFQRGANGAWQSRSSGGAGTNHSATNISNLNRQQQMRERGQTRMQNFQMARTFSSRGFGGFHGGGGRGRR